ncbi:MAG: biotin/lipoyl-binding protein, partial [Mariprofundaceae bacterium]
ADYWQGYVEGDYRLLAPEISGRIERLVVHEGQHVQAGDLLFVMEGRHAGIAVAGARARLEQAEAILADMQKGARPPRVEALRASLREAEAALTQARQDAARLEKLARGHYASASSLEQARTRVAQLQARVDRLHAEIGLARLPGRADRLKAARAEREAARAALDEALRLRDETEVRAPTAGVVERLIRRQGELASPSAPVLRLLPDAALKVIFFVPGPAGPRLSLDAPLSIGCDGCGRPRSARVSRLPVRAEYTPPVLFNRDNRQRLSYRFEARLDDTEGLFPGLPVEVQPAAGVQSGR